MTDNATTSGQGPDRWAVYGGGVPSVAPGWTFETVVAPARLGGANGIVCSPDGRQLLVTQVFASQVTAIDTTTGEHRPFAAQGEGIAAPDDGAFGFDGTFFATEPPNGTVSAKAPDGSYRVLRDDLPAINGITTDHAGKRLFADEFRPGGRLWELDPAGEKPPRLLLDDLVTPNALAMGPDGALWFPLVYANEVWRYDLSSGTARLAVGDLDRPCAVKFDSAGQLVVAESGAGRITTIDPITGVRRTVVELARGIDNLALSPGAGRGGLAGGDRLFVSHFTDGRVVEVLAGGAERVLSPSGLVGPYGLAALGDGRLVVADGLSLALVERDGSIERTHTLISDLPTLAVGVVATPTAAPDRGGPLDVLVAGQRGQVLRCRAGSPGTPVAGRLAEPTSLAPGAPGEALLVERGAGRVLRLGADGVIDELLHGLDRPEAVALGPDGTVWVTTREALLGWAHGEVRHRIDALAGGSGVVAFDGRVIVTLPVSGRLAALDVVTGHVEVVVDGAPLAPAVSTARVPLTAAPLALDGDSVVVGAVGDGSIRRLRLARR